MSTAAGIAPQPHLLLLKKRTYFEKTPSTQRGVISITILHIGTAFSQIFLFIHFIGAYMEPSVEITVNVTILNI